MESNFEIGPDFYEALAELFYRGKLEDYCSNDYLAVEHLCQLLGLVLDDLEKR